MAASFIRLAIFLRFAAVVAFVAFATTAACAQVQYVQICGDGSFYVPGTTNCINANQISANQSGIAQAAAMAYAGIAMSAALVDPFLPDHTNFAVSVHGAAFEDTFAVGVSGMMRLQGNLALSAGLAAANDSGAIALSERSQSQSGTVIPVVSWYRVEMLGRIGLTYFW